MNSNTILVIFLIALFAVLGVVTVPIVKAKAYRYPSVGKGPVIDLSKADNAVPVVRKRMLLCILLKSKVERVQQEFIALPLPAFRQQTGKRHLQHPVRTDNDNAVHHAGGPEIIAFADGGAGINQMPQTAGDPLRP